MKRYFIIFLLVFCLWPFISFSKKMSLEECISLATQNNPGLQTENINVEKSKILTGTAFDAPNTGIELSQDATDGGGMENGLKFSQEFEFPTLYVARHKALQADYNVARRAYDSSRNVLMGEISSLYYSLLYFARKTALLEELGDIYAEFEKIAYSRFTAGETSRLEYMNAERLSSKTMLEMRDIAAQKQNIMLQLMELVGTSDMIEPTEQELTVLEMPTLYECIYPEMTYQGLLAESEIERAKTNIGVAKQEFMPGLFVAATSQLLIKGFNPYHVERPRFKEGNFMGFQVGITVPLFFGAKRARLQAAKKDLELTLAKKAEMTNQLSREFAEARNEYMVAVENLGYFENKGISHAREMIRLARVSYDLGEIDYLEYMQNIETAYSIQMDYIDNINKVNQSVITLQTLQGTL